MNEFLQRMLGELKTNSAVNSEPLVKMLVESTNKSILLGENITAVYSTLKNGLFAIAESSNNSTLSMLAAKFEENEATPNSKVGAIASEVGISTKLTQIKESNAYANPIVKTKVDSFSSAILNGTPEFTLCADFINVFETYNYDSTVKSAVSGVSKYVSSNQGKISMLSAIFQLESMNSPIYVGAVSDLKNMLIENAYSADIIKLKYGNSIPLVTWLVNDLRIIESRENGSFTLGEGNSETRVNNLIAPSVQTKNGMIIYTDNRFISIRESKKLAGNEIKVNINGPFKIADVDPNFVRENYSTFYEVCEAYATLGFNKSADGLGVESSNVRNFKVGFKVSEAKSLDIYINNSKIESLDSINISEALSLEPTVVKSRFAKLFENSGTLFNFEFIKEVSNDRLMSEALLLNLNNTYFICEKVNSADRVWTEVSEYSMYEFFNSKFQYDISPIFKTKIDESLQVLKDIDSTKSRILLDIEKLETSIKKIDEACETHGIDAIEVNRLESIKDAIKETISGLNEQYISTDLLKKTLA